jgi:hypothetical protein
MVIAQKQSVDISFAKGVDTKTDPWRVSVGNFLSLENMIFTTGMRLTKRNGYGALPALPETATYLTTFNGNLTAIGSSLQAYSQGTMEWFNKGTLQPVELEVLPLIRSNTNQSQLDTAVSSTGLVCTVYTDQTPTSLSTPRYMYAIADSTTGQNIIEPTPIPVSSGIVTGSPRVFLLGSYFIIGFTNDISGTFHLQYIAISINNPTIVTVNTDIASSYTPSPSLSWDGVLANGNLYFAYNSTAGGQSIKMRYLSPTLALSGIVTFSNAGHVTATIMSMTVDNTNSSNPIIWATYYNSGSGLGYTVAVNSTLGTILAPTEWLASGTILNIATVAQNAILTIYYEVSNNYGYDATIPTHYISTNTVTQSGTVGTPTILVRSVGLASKAFIVGNLYYFVAAYQSFFQPTYFLINSLGEVVSRFAYSNGGGYDTVGLPSVTLNGNVAQIGYLFKDFITSQNTSDIQSITKSGIYSQTGLNLITFTVGTSNVVPAEIAQTLSLSGGFLWEYDGYIPVENNFFLWPDSVEGNPANSGGSMLPQEYQYQVVYTWTNNQGNIEFSAPSIPTIVDMSTNNPAFTQPTPLTFTASFTKGDYTIVVSSATGLAVGQILVDTTTSTLTPTAQITNGSNIIIVSSSSGLEVGQGVYDTTTPTNLQTGTMITAIDGLQVTLNLPATGSGTADALLINVGPGVQVGSFITAIVGTTVTLNLPVTTTAASEAITVTSICMVTLNIPTLRLTYKLANPVKIEIFRWSTAQEEFFQITSIELPLINDTTIDYVTYVDTKADNQIVGNSLIYTTGGVIEDIGAPSFNALTLFDDRLWGINSEDPNSLWFSKQVIETTPVEMSDLLTIYVAPSIASQGSTGNMKCIAPMDDKLIIFKEDALYYINGTGPNNLGAESQYSEPLFITSVVGSTNQQSIVFMPSGLMFQSDKGIWLLGRGMEVSYIGAPVEAYTKNAVVQSAVAVPGTTQVLFTLDSGITLMYDYFYQQWGTFVGVPAISSTLYQNLHTYLNEAGDVFQQTPGIYLDGSNPVAMQFTTSWINLAGLQGYQRSYFFYMLGQYISPHYLQCGIAYDYNPSITQSTTITPNNYSLPYGEDSPYGQGNPYGGPGDVEQWRVFLANQRCQAIQLNIKEIYDSSLNVPAGEGLRMSGINMLISTIRPFRAQPANVSAGSGTNGSNN